MKSIQATRTQLSVTTIKATTDRVRCLLTNATINLPEYSSTAFRLQQIHQAKQLLTSLESALQTQYIAEMSMK